MFRSGGSGGGVIGSGDSISVLVLSVCMGTLGTRGTSEHACVVPTHRTLGVVGCYISSHAVPPDVAVPRVVAEVICHEDMEVACNEVRKQDAGDEVGVVDTFACWWTTAVVGLFVTLFGMDVVLAQRLMRDIDTIRLRL